MESEINYDAPRAVIGLEPSVPKSTMVFHASGIERLRIGPDGFVVDGVRLDDPKDVYERFSDWLTHAGYPPSKPTRRKRRTPKP